MPQTQVSPTALSAHPDALLVSRSLDGDAAAFGALMQRHNPRLYRVARGVLGDEAEVEDVVQEAFVRAYASLGSFRDEASLPTWLTRIALNEALTRLRRRRPTVAIEALEMEQEAGEVIAFPGTAAQDPERAAARREIRHLLEEAIDHLPERFRTVFVMREVEEASVEETATCLGLRPETVKTRAHRAKRLLREALQGQLDSALSGTFPFAGARCARMSEAVLGRLGLSRPPPP